MMLPWLYEVAVNEEAVVGQLRLLAVHHHLVGIVHELRVRAVGRVLLQNLPVDVLDLIRVLPPLLLVQKDALLVLEVSAKLVDLEHPSGLPVREGSCYERLVLPQGVLVFYPRGKFLV